MAYAYKRRLCGNVVNARLRYPFVLIDKFLASYPKIKHYE